MGKIFELNIGDSFFEKVIKAIRKKEDIIVLLLETIKMFLVGNIIEESEKKGRVILKIDKMSRMIFEIEDKYFSFNFPFFIEKRELNDEEIRIYDSTIGIELDSKTVSIILGIFNEKILRNDSLEDICIELAYTEEISEIDCIWKLLRKLLLFESGYLRYDYDPKYENGSIHPLNHFDIYFSSGNTFKIGMEDKMTMEYFIDILDLQTDCYYLKDMKRLKK